MDHLCEKLKNTMKDKSAAKSMVTNAHHIINSTLTGSRSPAGLRRLGTATRISASLARRLSAFFGSTPDQDPKAAKYAILTPGPGMFVNVWNAPRGVKANVGHLCEKLKNGMRSGLEQHCSGNFLAIVAGTILSEKPNFTGRFSEG